MKRLKKLLVFAFVFLTIASFACEAAAAKPSIELTDTYFSMNSVGGVSPTVCFRNNSGKTIKYISCWRNYDKTRMTAGLLCSHAGFCEFLTIRILTQTNAY